MNIELEEVVVLDVTDDALELAAGGAGAQPRLNSAGCVNSYGSPVIYTC